MLSRDLEQFNWRTTGTNHLDYTEVKGASSHATVTTSGKKRRRIRIRIWRCILRNLHIRQIVAATNYAKTIHLNFRQFNYNQRPSKRWRPSPSLMRSYSLSWERSQGNCTDHHPWWERDPIKNIDHDDRLQLKVDVVKMRRQMVKQKSIPSSTRSS